RQYRQTQEAGEAFFCIVDLHSITIDYDPAVLRSSALDLAAMLLATGLDPERSTIFLQSQNPHHPEAAWLLSPSAAFGELRRMTQFKDKSEQQDFVSAALFDYPILMAADILLYQTDVVPVGVDQRQHVELTRNIAERFNSRFGAVLKLPQGQYPEEGARVMDLQEPTKKMSTSSGADAGRILLVDDPAAIHRKIMAAVTDTGHEVRQAPDKPGITNLIDIMSVATGRTPAEIEAAYGSSGYGTFKRTVADAVVALVEPITERFRGIRRDPAELQRVLARGADKAMAASSPTLRAIYDAMGFLESTRWG
ncbi:MAG: tryptophan--tRNA ligase, partial [Solirubrobacteraceae bacterium]